MHKILTLAIIPNVYLMGLATSSEAAAEKHILWQLESTSVELSRFSYSERVMLDTFQACFI